MKNPNYFKEYYKKNFNKLKAYQLEYYAKNKAKILEYANGYSSANRQKIRNYHLEYRNSLRSRVYELLGDTCIGCGFSDKRALQIDHVNSDGAADRKIHGSGSTTFLKKVIASAEAKENRYQVLCANCNMIKVETHGERKTKPRL